MMDIDDIKRCVAERKYVFSLPAEIRRKSANLTFQARQSLRIRGQEAVNRMTANEKDAQCPFCGSYEFEEQTTDYLYSHDDKYLLVPNMPVLVCVTCGMVYYQGAVLEEVERHFLAIYSQQEQPDSYVQMPTLAYAGSH